MNKVKLGILIGLAVIVNLVIVTAFLVGAKTVVNVVTSPKAGRVVFESGTGMPGATGFGTFTFSNNDSIAVVEEEVVEERMQYVCDMPRSVSTEYLVRTVEFSDGSVADMNWDYPQSRRVILKWEYHTPAPESFKRAVRMFKEYTGMAIEVVEGNHIAGPIDYVIPVDTFVHPAGNESAIAWIDNLSYDWVNGLTTITQARFGFNTKMMSYDDVSMAHVVLHELGHVYGLDHTHLADGLQTDSIMSYEDDKYEGHYLAGDIAGLQHLFCK